MSKVIAIGVPLFAIALTSTMLASSGCSSDDTTSSTSSSSSSGTVASSSSSSSSSSGSSGTSGTDAGPTFTLTLKDYLAWCNVEVNGGSTSTANQTLTFAPGTVVHLQGDTASTTEFVWGYWRGTAGDTTDAHDTSKTTTIVMDGNKTIQACCPLTSAPTTPCPAP